MTFFSSLRCIAARYHLLRWFLLGSLAMVLAGSVGIAGLYLYLVPKLPGIETLKDVRLQVPLRVYSRDARLIAEFGEMKRTPLRYGQLPEQMVQAILAAEDNRFFEHPGVDYQGLIRAALHLLRTGERGQGGSTITMQVARNFFLSREKTYTRKINEILLSLKIERELSKEEILELYLNKIYLGKRAYGVAAAAQVYYGMELDQLTLPQLAMIAGLPKAPSAYNPIIDPARALLRRNYVLRRMHELEFITDEEFQQAMDAPVTALEHGFSTEISAPFLAEMVRAEMLSRYGEDAYTYGYRVYTTVDSRMQTAANQALHNHLLAYEHRHGYRGAEKHIELTEEADTTVWQQALDGMSAIGGLQPALVVGLAEQEATIVLRDGTEATLSWSGMEWARPYINENARGAVPEKASDILRKGDVIRVEQDDEGQWQLAQVPEVSAALVSLHPGSGAVLALNGGFDYYYSKFNRATQAERQPGSNFKPFLYSAALANGFTPASIINDAPVVFADSALESDWRPENYSGRFYGPTRLREALVNSRNLVSIRLLQSIGISTAINYANNFGFSRDRLPRDLSLSLGSATMTPLEVVRGYATFANGGFLIEPYFIQRIEAPDGTPLFEANPAIACDKECQRQLEQEQKLAARLAAELLGTTEPAPAVPPPSPLVPDEVMVDTMDVAQEQEPRFAPRTVEERNVYLIRSIMQDVIRRGTGRRALQLGRNDLAGKTGTTNEQHDAWFSGFNNDVVTTVWVGFDNPQPLGARETGAQAALPMWIDYMREALRDKPEHTMAQPEEMVSVRIDANTGLYTSADNPDAIFELFRAENAPQPGSESQLTPDGGHDGSGGSTITEGLF
ncbi:MAG: penicillin-binding protein 1A [Gammaproteobacteria bacterium]|nr:penicillin-binding protein 1A [Gammaproteobacteria bacterium]MCW8959349.1 penicillin-binding protein 1A [Gammaproteobacteria bacterium]MCW8972546.1 penicillin-binding protein 1A [Gammaproteobacteria bacterium]MCW8993158.1 penicillin-binding protein 1A [Gammaproteobacteria bacterium]